jgi:hypothetical protein
MKFQNDVAAKGSMEKFRKEAQALVQLMSDVHIVNMNGEKLDELDYLDRVLCVEIEAWRLTKQEKWFAYATRMGIHVLDLLVQLITERVNRLKGKAPKEQVAKLEVLLVKSML